MTLGDELWHGCHVTSMTFEQRLVPVKPGTNEYDALIFLVATREFEFTPAEIAERTTISEASASKTRTRLFDKGLVEQAQGAYYIEPDRADELH